MSAQPVSLESFNTIRPYVTSEARVVNIYCRRALNNKGVYTEEITYAAHSVPEAAFKMFDSAYLWGQHHWGIQLTRENATSAWQCSDSFGEVPRA